MRNMPRTRIQHETTPEAQRAFLVGVELQNPTYRSASGAAHLPLESSMEELALLCKTAGLEVGGWGAGTPAVLRLTNGRDSMAVLVTTGGQLLRVDDGKLLRIQPGVLHAWRNHTNEIAILMYHVSEKYNPADPDEERYTLEEVGADWSTPVK